MLIFILNLCLAQSESSRPNVIVIVADDMGKHDVSMNGAGIQTPHLDNLAAEGVSLENYYVQPVCSPTRGSLLTGRYPFRLGLQHENLVGYRPAGLPLEESIMPEHFKTCGYKTYMVGKWQLGFFKEAYLPWKRGFDEFFGQLLGGQDYYNRRKCLKLRNHGNLCGFDLRTHEGPVRDRSMKYQPFLYADKAKEKFMSHNKTEPLYMYIAFQSVHRPLQAPWQFTKMYNDRKDMKQPQRIFAGMITALDAAVGEVVQGLKDSGLWNNTLLVFSNDNGRSGNDEVTRGGKNDFWQGGITGYGFISGPQIPKQSRGKSLNALMHVSDILPTMLSAAKCKVEMPLPIDGYNYWPLIDQKTSKDIYVTNNYDSNSFKRRREIVMQINPILRLWEKDPRNWDTKWDTRVQGVLIKGDMKLIVGSHSILKRKASDHQTVWLFNVTADSKEENDLSYKKVNLATQMLNRLAELSPEAKQPWHPLPDPRSNPALHGDFWGPYRVDSDEGELELPLPDEKAEDED